MPYRKDSLHAYNKTKQQNRKLYGLPGSRIKLLPYTNFYLEVYATK